MPRRNATQRPDGPQRVVIYTRLSDDRGDEAKWSHGSQEASCRAKAEALGMAVVGLFRDDGISGDRIDRPGLTQAVGMVQAGEADVLMTHSTDRLARSQQLQSLVVYEIRRSGGDVMSATEELPDGPLGDFMRSVHSFAAEMELVRIRERTTRAVEARYKKTGRYHPGGRPPYGYRRLPDASHEPDPEEAAVVVRIFTEAAAGRGFRQIAQGLMKDGIPAPGGGSTWFEGAVKRVLDRQTYATGEHEVWTTVVERGPDRKARNVPRPVEERYTVPFPVLIDEDLWAAAQAGRARNVWKTARSDSSVSSGILRFGFARCATCGSGMSWVRQRGRTPSYQCTRKKDRCAHPANIRQPVLDQAVAAWVREVVLDPVRATSTWVVVDEEPEVDPVLAARLAAATGKVDGLTAQVTGLARNLSLLSGTAARVAADELNRLSQSLADAEAEQERLTSEMAAKAFPARQSVKRISPEDAATRAADRALRMAWDAFKRSLGEEWDRAFADDPDLFAELYPDAAEELERYAAMQAIRLLPPLEDNPVAWAAWQALLGSLNVEVTVNQASADGPRWTAEIKVRGGQVTLLGPTPYRTGRYPA